MESVFVLRLTSIGVSGQFELGQGLRFLKRFPSLEKIPNSKQKLTLFFTPFKLACLKLRNVDNVLVISR